MKNLIFVKLGGGLITDKTKPYAEKPETIERLSREIIEAQKEADFDLVLGHGSGSFGHTSAQKYQTSKGFIDQESKYGFCKVHHDALSLNKIMADSLIKSGGKVFSISPASCFLADNFKISDSYLKVVKKLLEKNIIPLLYGDAVIDSKKGCCILSTEKIFVYLAKKLKPQKIILANKVDGVFTDDPLKNNEAQFIPRINRKNWKKIKKYVKGSDGIDVTGGMLDKVEKSLELAKTGSKVLIINGNKPDYLKKALLGELLGTQIEW